MMTENLNRRLLERIVPFNDIFYRTCYLNALIPIVKHFNKSILHLLMNEIILYSYKNAEEKKILEYIPLKPLNNLLDEMGLKYIAKPESNDLISDIRDAITEERPVILWIDCFYSPIRADMYQKHHWEHCIVVYGYDDDLQLCNVIEHKNRDNLSYEAQTMKYQDILKCCKGYQEHLYSKIKMPVFMGFYLEREQNSAAGEENLQDQLQGFKENMTGYQEVLYGGIESLKDYRRDFSRITGCQELLDQNMEGMLTALNQAINIKQVESYRLKLLFEDHKKLLELLGQIVMKWEYIRKVIAKYMYSSVYRKETFTSAAEAIEQIYELELQFHRELFQLLGQAKTLGIVRRNLPVEEFF